MDGKFFGSWLAARYGAPHLRRDGSITFVSGGAVVRPPAHGSMITSACAAIEALTRALAIELGPRRVNAIRPGYTDSEMWSFLSGSDRDDLADGWRPRCRRAGWVRRRTSRTPWCS